MRVIDAAIGAAWAMEEGALVTLLEIAGREHPITVEALEAYKAEPLKNGEKATFRDGVAIIGASGPMFKRANLMTAYCGASSYDVLMRDFATALDDSNVRAILVNVDSPGGGSRAAPSLLKQSSTRAGRNRSSPMRETWLALRPIG